MTPEIEKFIELLESQLGYTEKSSGYTKFGDWYGSTVDIDEDFANAPWCDMYLSWAAKKLGYEDWIGQFAYTVYHAQWFKEQDAWGTTPKPGAIVFFDWTGTNKISHIDHVGIVTRVDGGTIHTIEGNIDGGVAKRKERDTGKVVGYGYPEKIKARLDRQAAEKQEVNTSADVSGGNSVFLAPPTSLFSVIPAPVPLPSDQGAPPPEKSVQAAAESAKAQAAPPAAKTAPERGTASRAGTGSEKTPAKAGAPEKTVASGGTTQASTPASAPAPAAAGRTAPGKHAKPAAADTQAIATAPAAASGGLTPATPDLSSPTVLAPVLLAAAAIIAHARLKQSGLRLAFSGGGAERPSHRATGSHRAGGRRRAPGRRRLTAGAPLTADAPLTRRSFATQGFSLTREAPAAGGLPVPPSAPESTAAAGLGPVPTSEFPSVTTPVARIEETVSAERPRLPYQGRRRLRERPVVESSTFVQDAPLRGRRHRAVSSTSSTFVQDAPLRGRRHRRTEPAVSTTIPAALPVEHGDLLAPAGRDLLDAPPSGGYRGRRRREAVPV
ncbi:CHAP domain-containing protein [Planomonospora sp. ID82291]|uniref:CHAP domain-containing protein n=1 Tax=Planomonospora sp. ID82291 TaxID=2738136 RepID=UPI0018C3F248|nr:CHAP domain-containing protein [Planomonospora sp. ID82291]MBG0815823.1 CHAP domain-containing protein [Planomonospora sp. ID82291]